LGPTWAALHEETAPDSPEPPSFPPPLLDALASLSTPPLLLEPPLLDATTPVSPPPAAASGEGPATLALLPPPHAVAQNADIATTAKPEDERIGFPMRRSVSSSCPRPK